MVQELEREVGSLMQSQTDLAPDLGALLEQIAVLLQQLEQGHAAHACMAAAFQQEGHNQAEAVSSVAADQLQQQASRIAELHQRNLALEHERSGLEAQKQQVETALAQALEVNKKHAYAYAASEQTSKSQRASLAEAKHAAGMHAAALAACQEAAERASQQHAASLAAAKDAAVAHAANLTAYKEVADQAGHQNAAALAAAEVTAKQVAEEHAVSLVCHVEALSKAEQSHAAAIASWTGEKADLQAQLQALRASHSIELQSLHAELKCAMESSKARWVARKAELPTQLEAEHARQQAVGDAGSVKLQSVQAQLQAKQESRSHIAQELADQNTALLDTQAKLQPMEAQQIHSQAGLTAIPAGLTALAAHLAQQSPPPAAPPKDIGTHVSHIAADGQEADQQQLKAARQLIEQLQQQQQMLPTVQLHAQGPGIDSQPAAACQQGTPEHDGAGQDSAGEGWAQGVSAQGSAVQANGHLPALVLHRGEGMQESGTGVLSSAHRPVPVSLAYCTQKLMSSIVVLIRTTRQYCMMTVRSVAVLILAGATFSAGLSAGHELPWPRSLNPEICCCRVKNRVHHDTITLTNTEGKITLFLAKWTAGLLMTSGEASVQPRTKRRRDSFEAEDDTGCKPERGCKRVKRKPESDTCNFTCDAALFRVSTAGHALGTTCPALGITSPGLGTHFPPSDTSTEHSAHPLR